MPRIEVPEPAIRQDSVVQHDQDDDETAQIIGANLTVASVVGLLIPHVTSPHDKPATTV
jgi:hypothetical protein